MRALLLTVAVLCTAAPPAGAQLSIGIGMPGVSIGIQVPLFPDMQRVPGMPVYYAPRLGANYFFYDELYWVYEGDEWYASGWYNGPWTLVQPEAVPVYVLRVPVRYYRSPPRHFRGWQADAPPRWGQHWGPAWQQQHGGWDRWDRRNAPAPAPLPSYQRPYAGTRYPGPQQQQEMQRRDPPPQRQRAQPERRDNERREPQAAPERRERAEPSRAEQGRGRGNSNDHGNDDKGERKR
jgi:hypothetical protein